MKAGKITYPSGRILRDTISYFKEIAQVFSIKKSEFRIKSSDSLCDQQIECCLLAFFNTEFWLLTPK
jgi:hypothetical protein